MSNDGLEVGKGHEGLRNKALAFAHWTYHKFDGKLLVRDLQGKLKMWDPQTCKLGACLLVKIGCDYRLSFQNQQINRME